MSMKRRTGVYGRIQIRDDRELVQELTDHITYRLSGTFIRLVRERGYRDITFNAPVYPCYINYPKEDYLELYKIAGASCIIGDVMFFAGHERWEHRYDKDTGRWTERCYDEDAGRWTDIGTLLDI